jgi:hypothetical protein
MTSQHARVLHCANNIDKITSHRSFSFWKDEISIHSLGPLSWKERKTFDKNVVGVEDKSRVRARITR